MCDWGVAVSVPRLSYSDTSIHCLTLWCTKNLTFSGPALTKRPAVGLKSGTACCDVYQMRTLGLGEAKRLVKATQLSRGKDLSSTFGPGLRPLAVSTHASRSQGHRVTTHGGMDPLKQIRGRRRGAGQRAPSRRTRHPHSRDLSKRAGPVISRREHSGLRRPWWSRRVGRAAIKTGRWHPEPRPPHVLGSARRDTTEEARALPAPAFPPLSPD